MCRLQEDIYSDSEPLQGLGLIGRHNMAETMTPDALEPVAVDVLRKLRVRVVVLSLGRISRVPKDTRPFLDRLVEAGDVERLVDIAMEDLHSWVLPGVPWIHGANLFGPLHWRFVELSAGALAVPPSDCAGEEATRRFAAEFGCRSEEIRVHGRHHLLSQNLVRCINEPRKRETLTVIIAPEDSPVT